MKRLSLLALLFFASLLIAARFSCQWEQTSGPVGGLVLGLGSNGSSTVFASVIDGGIYRSTDNGFHWKPSGLSNQSIWEFFFTEKYAFAVSSYGSLFRSEDNGDSWMDLNISIWCFTVKGNYIFICPKGSNSGDRVLRSEDDGNTWVPMNNGITTLYLSSMTSNDQYVFAGTYENMFRSADNGEHWIPVNRPPQTIDVHTMITSGSTLFAFFTDSSISGGVLYRSTDNGDSWNLSGLQGSYITHLAKMENSIFAVVSSGIEEAGIYRTDDNGLTWKSVNSNLQSTDISTIATNSEFVFLGLNQMGIAHSASKGADWVVSNNGLKAVDIIDMIVLDNDLYACNNSGGGIYYSSNNGNTWKHHNVGLPSLSVNSLAVDKRKSKIFALTDVGVFYMHPTHQIWTLMENAPITDSYIKSLAIDGKMLYVGMNNGEIYRSTNGGLTWDNIMTTGKGPIIKFTIGSNVVYAVMTYGTLSSHQHHTVIFRSIDDGTTWIESTVFDELTYDIASSGNMVFSGNESGVYRSMDQGLTWTLVLSGTAENGIRSIYYQGNAVVAGTGSGKTFVSWDNGDTWGSVSGGLHDGQSINCLVANEDYLFSGVSSNSVWRNNSIR